MRRSPMPRPSCRRRMMACTTSIGPGATNMVTAAARRACQPPAGAAAARRRLRQRAGPIRCCSRSRISATARSPPTTASGRCRAISTASRGPSSSSRRCRAPWQVLTDPAECGPVTLALCQDVQAEAYDYPESFFAERVWTPRRTPPGRDASCAARRGAARSAEEAADRRRRRRALLRGRGALRGLLPSGTAFRSARPRPASRALPDDHPAQSGRDRRHRHRRRQRARRGGRRRARGRHAAAGFHHRLVGAVQERRTGGSSALNVAALRCRASTARCRWWPTRARGCEELGAALGGWRAPDAWTASAPHEERRRWLRRGRVAHGAGQRGAALRCAGDRRGAARGAGVRHRGGCAAGGLPGELHKLWQAAQPGGYHLEYGYSCMGYEIAGGARA